MLSPLSTKPPIHAFTICDPFVVDWLHPQHPLGTTHTHTHMCAHTHILCSFTPHSPQLSIHPSSIQGLSFTEPSLVSLNSTASLVLFLYSLLFHGPLPPLQPPNPVHPSSLCSSGHGP